MKIICKGIYRARIILFTKHESLNQEIKYKNKILVLPCAYWKPDSTLQREFIMKFSLSKSIRIESKH